MLILNNVRIDETLNITGQTLLLAGEAAGGFVVRQLVFPNAHTFILKPPVAMKSAIMALISCSSFCEIYPVVLISVVMF